MATKKLWMPFSDARLIVRSQGFRNQTEYSQWPTRPPTVPANPRSAYGPQWKGWADWLGTGLARTSRQARRGSLMPFEKARDLARTLVAQHGIANQPDWYAWAKSDARPVDLPVDPSSAYKNCGWAGWPDWFGRSPTRATSRNSFRDFTAARELARSLGLKTGAEWSTWAAGPHRPADIPLSPETVYRTKGWIGWGDFLGFHSRWTHHGIVSFLESLKPVIASLSEFDLYLILSRNGMLRRDARLRFTKLLKSLSKLRRPEDIDAQKQMLANELSQDSNGAVQGGPKDVDANDDVSSLSPLAVLKDLKVIDHVTAAHITDDPEVLDFMIRERVEALWKMAMEEGVDAARSSLPPDQGHYARLVRETFETELKGALSIAIPDGFSHFDPNLMQRLTAFRLVRDQRLGNWSGVGAGKTLAATFSAGVLKARFTLIVTANAVRSEWARVIEDAYPGQVHVYCGRPRQFQFMEGMPNFFIVNYEAYQQRAWSRQFFEALIRERPVDFLVFDEVQYGRQRHVTRISERRQTLGHIARIAAECNPELRILGMSATPVINNLREAVTMLELIQPGEDFSAIEVGSTMAHAAGVHMLLRKFGIRWVPDYEGRFGLEKTVETPHLDGSRLLDRLLDISPAKILQMEQALLDVKLEHLPKWLERGTMIYTYYVEGMVDRIAEVVTANKLQCRIYTGRSRVPIDRFTEDFERGDADVLIGSAPVGTGVNGLQKCLHRLVFLTLPWSNAEYQQIVGRLYRQGRTSGKVEVIIPLVTLREERAGVWSWDDRRLRLVEYKRSLADAAVDGAIPADRRLPSKIEMQKRSIMALHSWAGEMRQAQDTRDRA